ncbi:MAG TPA: hypothetical protein VKT52_04840 [Ktedonobacterales bacterium]|nr:hypothetical protein [Ktedonobacterales bacterium]
MPTYLERYLAGEREAVWAELTTLGPAIRDEPLFADAQAVARETMTRARANVELLVQRLTALGYRFIGDALGPNPTPYAPPTAESLATLGDIERQYGILPLSIEIWYEIVGAVDFMGVYPRLSAYTGMGAEGYVDMMLGGERIRVRSAYPFYVRDMLSSTEAPDPDVDITSDPLVIWPCIDALVDELPADDEEGESPSQHYLGFAPDALHKANVSGGDGPHIAFGDARMDAPLLGDDWEGVPFITYLRTAFAWGGFPGLRDEISPPRDLVELLCEGLLPL